MNKEEQIIEAARECASCYFVKEWRDKLPNAMAELDHLLKEYYKEKK